MKNRIIKAIGVLALLAMTGCVAFVFVGCQTAVNWEKRPEVALPLYEVREVNGVQQLVITDYRMASGGWELNARSPLWAREQFNGFTVNIASNGVMTVTLDAYNRDLSTNAVVMVKTIFDGSTNLALAVAKAYATIQTGGGVDATSAIVNKVVSYFKSKGGDASKSTVTSDGQTIKVTDGVTCISCDSAGNCSSCSPAD